MTQPTQEYYKNSDGSYDSRYPDGDKPEGGGGGTGTLIAAVDFSAPGIDINNLTDLTPEAETACYGPGRSVEDGMLKIAYPSGTPASDPALGFYFKLTPDKYDIVVEFDAKMPGVTGGCKFMKFHGLHSVAETYHNLTIPADYTGLFGANGAIGYVAYGDGSTTSGDTGHLIFFDDRGDTPSRNTGVATISRPKNAIFEAADWGASVHSFYFAVKSNSGTTSENEVPDGELLIKIDGEVWLHVTNMFNRHYSNPRGFDHVDLGGTSQSNPSPFDIFYGPVSVTRMNS